MNYVVGDCQLGEDLRLEIPNDVETGDLINKDGYLFNSTGSTINVYSDKYPEYSFRLPPMSGLQYRADNYTYVEIPFSIDFGPYLAMSLSHVFLFGTLLISALLIICKGGAKRG